MARTPTTADEQAVIDGVALTHPDRVLYPGQGITKRALVAHYQAMAERMLPHLVRRPLSLVRCPAGNEDDCFYQKHASAGFPDALKRVRIQEKTGSDDYLYVEDRAGLVAAVQMGVLELHVWGAHVDTLEAPDRMVFDLDPAADLDFAEVTMAASEMRERLRETMLESFLLATGGKGLHVVVPLGRSGGWEAMKRFAERLAREMAADSPQRYLAKASKAARAGRIFIDYLRNARGATAVAPFSTRAHAGAPVAWPLPWSALAGLTSARPVTVADAAERLTDDPWGGYFDLEQALPTET